LRLALIATFHARHEATLPLLRKVLVDSTRTPDELWVLCEDEADTEAAVLALNRLAKPAQATASVVTLPTPQENGCYKVIPYSHKINWALDRTTADAICYLDNGSMPAPHKYAAFVEGLEQHPEWGCVYVTQERTGHDPGLFVADEVIANGEGRLNFTQFSHRRTADRWTTDMRWANPDVADALFMRDLAVSLGPMFPVGGPTVGDWHDMPSAAAAGVV
jgi:hypothetical protein